MDIIREAQNLYDLARGEFNDYVFPYVEAGEVIPKENFTGPTLRDHAQARLRDLRDGVFSLVEMGIGITTPLYLMTRHFEAIGEVSDRTEAVELHSGCAWHGGGANPSVDEVGGTVHYINLRGDQKPGERI